MTRIISAIIILVCAGLLVADPIANNCMDSIDVNKNMEVYKNDCQAEVKVYDDAEGQKKDKYEQFKISWTKIADLTKNFVDTNFPENCFDNDGPNRLFGNLFRFLKAKSELSKKEYLAYTDPNIIKKVEHKTFELDACFEDSRNMTGIDPADTKINFCSYEMNKGLECSKQIFENDDDEPLLALISFTNYFVLEFNCEGKDHDELKDTMTMHMFNIIAETNKKKDRQSFFYGYLRVVEGYTNFD